MPQSKKPNPPAEEIPPPKIEDPPAAPTKPQPQLITTAQYLMGRDVEYPLSASQRAKMITLLEKVNALAQKINIQRRVSSGYRPGKYNTAAGGAPNSSHLTCEAIDLADADRVLTNYIMANKDILVEFDLYMEDPRYTKTWVHLQTRRTRSGDRIFIPY